MPENYRQLFQNYKPVEPPAGLLSSVIARLREEQRRSLILARCRLALITLVLLASPIALVVAVHDTYHDLSTSGFFQFLSLIFSDFFVIVGAWQSYLFSLLETLPVASIVVSCGVLFIFLEALRYFARTWRLALRHFTF